jgi:hypothetical protein
MCFGLSVTDGKIEQRVCIKFGVKLGKSATKTLEMLHEAFGEHSSSQTWSFNGIHVSRSVECQLKMTNVQGDQAPAKRQKMLKKFENLSTKTIAKQSMNLQTTLGPVNGDFQEILTENLNMWCIAPSSQQCAGPHVPENHRVCD